MNKCLLYSIGIGISALYWSCVTENKSGQHTAEQEETTRSIEDTLAYHVEIFQEISPYFSGTETELDTTFFAARYPVFTLEIDSLVREAIFVDGEENANQVAESFLGGFNEYAEDQIASDNAFHAWFRDQDCDIMLNVPGFLSLKNTIRDYTGGAHGLEIEIWSSYDIQQMQKLSLTDLIQDTDALHEITERHFRKQEELSDTSAYGDAYFFDDGMFSLADNFGLTKAGLIFHYNPYEIKPYAAGPTTLVIPYRELEDAMTENGKRLLAVLNEDK